MLILIIYNMNDMTDRDSIMLFIHLALLLAIDT